MHLGEMRGGENSHIFMMPRKGCEYVHLAVMFILSIIRDLKVPQKMCIVGSVALIKQTDKTLNRKLYPNFEKFLRNFNQAFHIVQADQDTAGKL